MSIPSHKKVCLLPCRPRKFAKRLYIVNQIGKDAEMNQFRRFCDFLHKKKENNTLTCMFVTKQYISLITAAEVAGVCVVTVCGATSIVSGTLIYV